MPITPDEKLDKYKLLSYIILHSLIIAVSALITFCIMYSVLLLYNTCVPDSDNPGDSSSRLVMNLL